MSKPPAPVVVAITGASGAPYAVRLLEMLANYHVPTWLLVSVHGWRLMAEECGIKDEAGLKKATGGDWTSIRSFNDADRGAETRDGGVPVFDGHDGRDRARHQPVAHRAGGGRHAEGEAQARARAARDAAIPRSPAQHDTRGRGRRDHTSRGAGILSTPPRNRSAGGLHRAADRGSSRAGDPDHQTMAGVMTDVRELLSREVTPELYREIRELWKAHSIAEDKRDIAGLIATLTPDCVYEVIGEAGARWEGHAGATRFYTELLGAIPDIHFDLQQIVIGPQGVCEEAKVTGTQKGR